MGIIKNKSIKALGEHFNELSRTTDKVLNSNANADTLKTLYNQLLENDDKKSRQRLMNDFKKKNSEFAEFIANNPQMIKNELERAVIMSAVGGEIEETEISVDSKGRKQIKRSKKQIAPNPAAAIKFLEKTVPEVWGDNATGEQPENNLLEILKNGLNTVDVQEENSGKE